MLSFLEFYQSEPVLWDPTHAHHKDKKRINDAWQRISNSMGCSVHKLKKKKDSLMATFRAHLRKKKAAMRSGAGTCDTYKPVWFAYEYMESFLGPLYECNTTRNSQILVSTRKIRQLLIFLFVIQYIYKTFSIFLKSR